MPAEKFQKKPPLLARSILNVLSDFGRDHAIKGDLEEEYQERHRRRGTMNAAFWYWFQVLYLVPVYMKSIIKWEIKMITNYIKIAFRNILKNRTNSLINVFGMSIGIVCFILIGLYVMDELSYDQYHAKADRIYRVGVMALANDNEFHAATCCAPMAGTLVDQFPEVEASVKITKQGYPAVRYGERSFSEERWFYVDPSIFNVFTIPLTSGDPDTALIQPYSVVLSKKMVKKYFGAEDPMGKILRLDNRRDFKITGVMENVPHNSHFKYDFLASFASLKNINYQNWMGENNYHTYFVLKEGISAKEFDPKLQGLVKKYVAPQVKNVFGASLDQLIAKGSYFHYIMQPLTDIHLHSNLQFEHEPNGNMTIVYIFSIIAFAILILACINFVNLATANASKRGKEVGIRKTIGSNRSQMVRQFMSETIFLSIISTILSIPIIQLTLQSFNTFTGKSMSIPYFSSPVTIPLFLGFAIALGIIAGAYPAFYLGSFHPVKVLKGETVRKGNKSFLRSTLVVFQFSVSIILIIGTLIIYQQLNYIQNSNLGFQREQVLIIHKVDDLGKSAPAFKQELLQIPGILHASNTSNLPGTITSDELLREAGKPKNETILTQRFWADKDLIKTYGIQIKQGRYFSSETSPNQREVIINETALKAFRMKNPVNQIIVTSSGREYTIIGVVKDFHFESLEHNIKPLLIHPIGTKLGGGYISAKISAMNIESTISRIKQSWDKFAAGQIFEFEFFDDYFSRVYLSQKKTGQIILIFSMMAIFIASLGLFGLALFTAERKTKEIAIRKVMGASVLETIRLLVRQFSKWVLISNIIAWPLAYIILRKWLENFSYRTSIQPWVFILAGLISLGISLLTVSFQTVKAASKDPVCSLKHE